MKKGWIAVFLCAILVLFAAAGCSSDIEPTESTAASVSEYVAGSWCDFEQSYDENAQLLTLSRMTTMTYENACAYGARVYANELAPETYVEQASSIRLDVLSHCDCPELRVVLQYLSSDGEAIFSADSDGTVVCCWD